MIKSLKIKVHYNDFDKKYIKYYKKMSLFCWYFGKGHKISKANYFVLISYKKMDENLSDSG